MVDAYYFCVGGSVGEIATIARPVGYRCRAEEVPDAISRLLSKFKERPTAGENIQKFLARHGNEELRAILAGATVAAAERDIPEGRVPHGVEG